MRTPLSTNQLLSSAVTKIAANSREPLTHGEAAAVLDAVESRSSNLFTRNIGVFALAVSISAAIIGLNQWNRSSSQADQANKALSVLMRTADSSEVAKIISEMPHEDAQNLIYAIHDVNPEAASSIALRVNEFVEAETRLANEPKSSSKR